MTKNKNQALNWQFWKIGNKEQAEYVIKQSSYGFLVAGILNFVTVAVLYFGLGFKIGLASMIDGVIYLVLALLLLKLKSRVVAVILLLISGIGVVATFLNQIGVTVGGRNVILAVVIFYFAIASVYATFKYPKLK